MAWGKIKTMCVYVCVCVQQEPDYGSLYEGRNPGFYVEANQMPTFKVMLQTEEPYTL